MRIKNKINTMPLRSRSFYPYFKKVKTLLIGVLLFVLLTPTFVQAVENPLDGIDSFPDLISTILKDIVVPIGAVIAALAIVYSGFLFVTAQGNTEQLSKARSAFLWAVIGGLILIGSWAIAEAIQATLDPIIN
ncbi:MAG: TrbC/VirB2 family protein [Candidatus Paceibacterota bacterium]